MTRVIAGSAGGLRLRVPKGHRVRPTADRVKEALFSSLGDLAGLMVADLYAGSGALGIEALSRGAAHATFVEADRRVAGLLRANLRAAGLAGQATVVTAPVSGWARTATPGLIDLILADPPYATPLTEVFAAVAALHAAGALTPHLRVVVERDRRDAADEVAPVPRFLAPSAPRTYGDTVLRRYYHRDQPPP